MSAPATAAAPPAGFWHRYAAWSLDAAVLGGIVTLVAWPRLHTAWQALGLAFRDAVAGIGEAMADALMAGIPLPRLADALLADPRLQAAAASLQAGLWQLCWPLLLGYALLAAPWHVVPECTRWRGSPGKRALGLAVTDLQGSTQSPARAALRHVAGLLSWLSLNLGHALAALPPHKRALHDYVAGTRVVHAGGDARLPAWARAWITLQLVALFALLCWLMLRYVALLETGLAP